ncbi:MAG: serine/threonine protein phosphatase [Proteobacteria bacterium]|nr:serine/threonine protein phosphatase [Pseudomonadota bacterium]MBU1708966.1 serine/threonine protein phosphatase [Pseudomonadota bacterium]
MNRTYVIGDIHGCHRSLLQLLDNIKPDIHNDTIIFLGDYIDRGPDSKEVINEILLLQARHDNVVTLMGNHELSFLKFLDGEKKSFFLEFGGVPTLQSYGAAPPYKAPQQHIPPEHLSFLKELHFYWEDDSYIYVHAGLKPGVHLTQQSSDWMLWSRSSFIQSDYDFGKKVIFGHTPFKEPFIQQNKIGIDTGSVYGGRLTCLILPDLEFVSVDGECHASGPF